MKNLICFFIILFIVNTIFAKISINPNWMANETQKFEQFGYAVSSADINGDGFSDIIIGAPYYDNGQVDEGRVYVYYGSPNGLSKTADWRMEGKQYKAHYGNTVSSADVNGDSYDDIIVSASGYSFKNCKGAVIVYYGSKEGLSKEYNWLGKSNNVNEIFCSVSTAGDVNGDGYDEVIVSAYYSIDYYEYKGAVFVYYGSASGLDTNYAWRREGKYAHEHYGSDISTAGDVNGDGYDDIIVGASGKNIDNKKAGAAYVYYGGKNGLDTNYAWVGKGIQFYSEYGYSVCTAGDVNGDNYDDIIVGAPKYNNKRNMYEYAGAVFLYYGSKSGISEKYNWMGNGEQRGAYYGSDISTAGDINGDGYDDIIVASKYDKTINLQSFNNSSICGKVFIYYGSKNGITENYDIIEGEQYLGTNISTAGDVNGDRYDDIIIGSFGKVYVYYGNPVIWENIK